MKEKRTIRREATGSPGTADRIMQEAARLFAERGYDGASINEISTAAGANIAAVNYHFGTKANLFSTIIEQFLSDLFTSSRKALVPPQSPTDLAVRLEVFVRQTMEAISRQPEAIAIIHRETDRSNEVFKKTIMKHREALIAFLEQAKKKGFLAPDIDAVFAARFLMAQIAQSRRRNETGRDLYGRSKAAERFREEWIQQTLRLFLGGIVKR